VRTMITPNAAGKITARAVAIFSDVDKELQNRTGGARDIFDLVRRLREEQQPVDARRLRDLAGEIAGSPVSALSGARVPGTR